MHKRYALVLGLAAVLVLIGAGCNKTTKTDSADNAAIPSQATTPENVVTIQGFSFQPATITVKKGTTVTWTNNDPTNHTVTGDTGGPASDQFRKGESYAFTFDTVGEYPYHCTLHATMKGTVVVTE